MRNKMRTILFLLFAGICGGCLATAFSAEETPILRYTSYLLVEVGGPSTVLRAAPSLSRGGKPAQVAIESRPYGSLNKDYTYKDQPTYTVISADGHTMGEQEGKLGSATTMDIPTTAGAFAIIEAKPGNNYCIARTESAFGLIATETAALNVVKGFERLYFFVPKGLDAASIFFHAFSVGEAARVLIYDADGRLAYEGEDDFNSAAAVSFQILDGQDGRVWSLALVEPKNPQWKIDDCKLWMSGSLPGILSPKPEWAEKLSRPFIVEWRRVFDFEGEIPIAATQWNQPAEKGLPLPAADVTLSEERPHSGKKSLRIEMNPPGQEKNTPNMLKIFTKPFEAAKVDRVRFWLYGDGSGRKTVVRIRDQNNENHQVSAGAITWTGWGEVVADFTNGKAVSSGGDENKCIDGPKVSIVIQIVHEAGQPAKSVYYVDDLSVSP